MRKPLLDPCHLRSYRLDRPRRRSSHLKQLCRKEGSLWLWKTAKITMDVPTRFKTRTMTIYPPRKVEQEMPRIPTTVKEYPMFWVREPIRLCLFCQYETGAKTDCSRPETTEPSIAWFGEWSSGRHLGVLYQSKANGITLRMTISTSARKLFNTIKQLGPRPGAPSDAAKLNSLALNDKNQ